MSEWKETTLTEISSEISYGFTASANTAAIGPKFLRITDIVPDRINWQSVPFCEANEKEKNKYKLLIGDIVIARTGATTGYNKIIKNLEYDAVYASYLIRYRIDSDKAYPFFIGHVLQSTNWFNFIDSVAGGSAQPGANAKLLGSYELMLPPLPEQKAIAGVLSSLDDKIDLLHRQNKTLEAMAETLFRQWFVEEAEDDWEEVSLKSLCKVITKGTTPTTMNKKFVNSGVNFIKVNCIDENEYLLPEKFNYIDTETHLLLKRSQLEQGDILYSIAGTIGRIAQVSEELLPANINQALAIIRVNMKLISPYYIKYYLKSRATEYLLHSKIVHAVQPNLSLGEISNILVPLPNGKTYEMFCNVINRIEGRIENNKTTITKSKKTRDILLPKLMSEEVRVEL